MGLDCPFSALGDHSVLFDRVQVLSFNRMVVVLDVSLQGLWLPTLAMAADRLLRLFVGRAMSWAMSGAKRGCAKLQRPQCRDPILVALRSVRTRRALRRLLRQTQT